MDRYIHTEWSDDEYICELSDAHYRIYDLLIKNTSRIGIAKVSASQMCWRANKMDRATYTSIISQLAADGKIATHNGYLAILNHHKYWDYSKPNTAKGAVYDILEIIDDVLDCEPVMIAISNVLIRLLRQNKCNKTFNDLYTMVIDKVYNNYSIPILYADKPIKDIDSDSDSDSDIDIETDIDNKQINPPAPPLVKEVVPRRTVHLVNSGAVRDDGRSEWATGVWLSDAEWKTLSGIDEALAWDAIALAEEQFVKDKKEKNGGYVKSILKRLQGEKQNGKHYRS